MKDARGTETMSGAMKGVANYYRWIYAALSPHLGASIVEIGPGYGNMSRLLVDGGKKYVGIDSDAGIIGGLQREYPELKNHFICGDVTSAAQAAELRARGVDTLLSMNVLEHIEDDVAHLRGATGAAPGGRVVLFVPAMPFLYGTFDEQAGHFRRYTAQRIRDVFVQAGLKTRHVSYFNAVGGVAWLVAGRIMGLPLNGEGTNSSISLYDRVVMPVARGLDPLLNWLGGQSLIAVADIPVEPVR